ncbi:Uncharacterized protein FKW44_019470, partial [Caligus rogercresseyi]
MKSCRICSWSIYPGESSYSLALSRTTLSNVSLLFKVFEFLGIELPPEGSICHTCFEIVEEIDFFEQNTAISKEKLREKLRFADFYKESPKKQRDGRKIHKRKVKILSQMEFDVLRL